MLSIIFYFHFTNEKTEEVSNWLKAVVTLILCVRVEGKEEEGMGGKGRRCH